MGMERKVGFKALVSYGMGDLYGGGSFLVISTLFLFFLTDVVGLEPALAGLVVFVGKAWDAVSDPLMGCISDRTRSRFGRRRIYFLVGALPVFASFALLWISFPAAGPAASFLYYFFAYLLFCTVFTMVMVPYSSLPAEMSADYRERTRLAGARMFFSQLSAILSGTIPGYLVHSRYSGDPATGFLLVGLGFGLFYALPWIFVFRGTWEREESESAAPSTTLPQAFVQMRRLLDVRSFRLHIGMYLLGYSALDVLSALFVYYLGSYIGNRSYYTPCLGAMLLAQLVALPVHLYGANRLGKGRAYAIGGAAVTLVACLFFAVPRGAPLAGLLALSAALGLGLSAVVAMPWAMIPESADADELAGGGRRTGAVAGTFTLARKLVQAAVLWAVGIALSAMGYRSGGLPQEGAAAGIRLLFSFGPLILVASGTLLALRYPVDPHTDRLMRAELERRRKGGAAEGPGEEAADMLERVVGRRP